MKTQNTLNNSIIKHNKRVQKNKREFKERESIRLQQIRRDYNKDKIIRNRICKDCHTIKCIYNGKDEEKCKYYHMFNSLYLTKEKKERKRAITIDSEEGKRYLKQLTVVRV